MHTTLLLINEYAIHGSAHKYRESLLTVLQHFGDGGSARTKGPKFGLDPAELYAKHKV
jgi:hypothetical protein